jgi:hypothetical protein
MNLSGFPSRQSTALPSFCAFLILISLTGCGTRETSFVSPEDAAHNLENCTTETCPQLSASLHLGIPLRPKLCSVGALHGTLEPDSDDALLKIQCSQGFQIVLLTRESRRRWQYADSMPFPFGAHDVITVTLQKLIDPSGADVVIHGDTVAFGTGAYQADFLVVQASHRKFHTVLDTVEKGTAMVEPGQSVEQQSLFAITPATEKECGSITEKMTLKVDGQNIVVEREFNWQKDLGIFAAGLWYAVRPSASPIPEKPKAE